MSFLPARLMEIAENVSQKLELATFPIALQHTLPFAYSLNIQSLPDLTINLIQAWFTARGLLRQLQAMPDRRLFGCLVAQRGHGVIFLDSNADDAERRFTLAHEFSHFLLDHLIPREEAITAFGKSIRPVLDGERPPTDAEKLDSLRLWIDMQPFHHLMQRDSSGRFMDLRTSRAELDADMLALELLAPHQTVLEHCGTSSYTEMIECLLPLLTAEFELPPDIAHLYAAQLAGHFAKEESLRHRFSP
jgi:hypothetical protein